MKFLILTFVIFFASISQSTEEKFAEKKDFGVICAISKAAEALSKDKYVIDRAEKVSLVSSALEATIKTEEVKKVIKAVAVSEPSQKVKLMKQAAADVGLKKWNCNSIKFLF